MKPSRYLSHLILILVLIPFLVAGCRFPADENFLEDIPSTPTLQILNRPEQPTQAAPETSPGNPIIPAEPGIDLDALEVVQYSIYTDRYSRQVIAGLLSNPTSTDLTGVQLAVEFYDIDNKLLSVNQISLYTADLPVGELGPFALVLPAPVAGAAFLNVEVLEASPAPPRLYQVEPTGVTYMVDDLGDIHITGELVNRGDAPARIEYLVGAVFTADGALIALGPGYVMPGYLGGGGDDTAELQQGPFRVSLPAHLGDMAPIGRAQVWVASALVPPLELEVGLADFYNFVDQDGRLHLVSEITNLAGEPAAVRLLVGLYDQAGLVIDAAIVNLPFGALPTAETVPFAVVDWGPVNWTAGLYDLRAYDATIQVDPLPDGIHHTAFEVVIEDIRLEIADGRVVVEAVVINRGTVSAQGWAALLALRCKTREAVVAVGVYQTEDVLLPSGSNRLLLDFPVPGDLMLSDVEIIPLARGFIEPDF